MAAVPPVSVVMPVHNALPYLDISIASILGQSFGDFEFLILDDGSTDGSLERLREWSRRDRRIRLVEGFGRSGPVASSNRVVEEARAPLIARMDADDLARSDRLELQLRALAEHPDAVLIGTLYDIIDSRGRQVRQADYARLVRRSPFAPFGHSTILFRRDAFERSGGYRTEAARWEDVDLYLNMAQVGRILVVAQPLVSFRQSETSTRLTSAPSELEQAMDLMYRTVLGKPRGRAGKLLPYAFLPGGSIRVWNGHRPRILGRLWRYGALGRDLATARILAWALWGEVNPRGLRLALRLWLAFRNLATRRRFNKAKVVEWQPGAAAIETGRAFAFSFTGPSSLP